jgi:hypothetical protein
MRKFAVLSVIALLFVVAIGCSDRQNSPTTSNQPVPTQQQMPVGIQSLIDQNTPGNDGSWPATLIDPSLIVPDSMDTNFQVYLMTFLWGNIDSSSSGAVPTDWSGSVSFTGSGLLAPTRIISFERGQDSLLPRTSPVVISWVSKTLRDFDGLSMLLFVRRNSPLTVIPQVQFNTAPISVKFDTAQLKDLNAFYRIDDNNGLAVHSHRLFHPFCPHGVVAGQWIRSDTSAFAGTIKARWLDADGNPIGVLDGLFWKDANAAPQFKGRIITASTRPFGTVSGVWTYDDPRMCPMCGEGHGRLVGRINAPGGALIGMLSGQFGNPTIPTPRALPMSGIWRLDCNRDEDVSIR